MIFMSKGFVLNNEENEIKNIILHEIAHALVGIGEGHSRKWKNTAIDIGCNGKRTNDTAVMPKGKFIYKCKNCGHKIYTHRRLRLVYSCLMCKAECPDKCLRTMELKTTEAV